MADQNLPAPYEPIQYPYPGTYEEITRREARAGLELLLKQKAERIDRFQAYLLANTGIELSTSSTFEELDVLPEVLAGLGKRIPVRQERVEELVGAMPKELQGFFRSQMPKWEPDMQSLLLGFDAGLLWGDIFIRKYPSSHWAIGRGGKTCVDFQHPVITAQPPTYLDFNPIRELSVFIHRIVSEKPDRWKPSMITKHRAFALGLDVNPLSATE